MLSILKRPHQSKQFLGYKLHKLSVLLDRQANDYLIKSFDITLTQFVLLFGLEHYPQASQSVVAKYLNLTQAAVSRQMDGLIEKGLIERQSNPQSRREHLLKATPNGQTTLVQAKSGIEEIFQQAFRGVSRIRIRLFEKVVTQMLTNIGSHHG